MPVPSAARKRNSKAPSSCFRSHAQRTAVPLQHGALRAAGAGGLSLTTILPGAFRRAALNRTGEWRFSSFRRGFCRAAHPRRILGGARSPLPANVAGGVRLHPLRLDCATIPACPSPPQTVIVTTRIARLLTRQSGRHCMYSAQSNPILWSRRAKRRSVRYSSKTGSTPRSGRLSSRCCSAFSSISNMRSFSFSPA